MNVIAEGMHELIDKCTPFIERNTTEAYPTYKKMYFGLEAAEKRFLANLNYNLSASHEDYIPNMNYGLLWILDQYFTKYDQHYNDTETMHYIQASAKGEDASNYSYCLRRDAYTLEKALGPTRVTKISKKCSLEKTTINDTELQLYQWKNMGGFSKTITNIIIDQVENVLGEAELEFQRQEVIDYIVDAGLRCAGQTESYVMTADAPNPDPYFEPITDQYIEAVKAHCFVTGFEKIGINTQLFRRTEQMLRLTRSRQFGFMAFEPEYAWQIQMKQHPEFEKWMEKEQRIIHASLNKILGENGTKHELITIKEGFVTTETPITYSSH